MNESLPLSSSGGDGWDEWRELQVELPINHLESSDGISLAPDFSQDNEEENFSVMKSEVISGLAAELFRKSLSSDYWKMTRFRKKITDLASKTLLPFGRDDFVGTNPVLYLDQPIWRPLSYSAVRGMSGSIFEKKGSFYFFASEEPRCCLPVPPFVSSIMSAKIAISSLEHQNDHETFLAALQSINEYLKTLPTSNLSQNDLEYVGYFVQWIHHAFKDWSSIPSLSKFFREGHKKNEILKELLEAMIVFGVAQCSLSSLLSAVEVVLAEAKMLSDVKLDISSVQKLRNWNGKDFRLAICSLSDLCAIYHLNLPVKNHEKASRSSHQLFKTTLPSEPWAFDKKKSSPETSTQAQNLKISLIVYDNVFCLISSKGTLQASITSKEHFQVGGLHFCQELETDEWKHTFPQDFVSCTSVGSQIYFLQSDSLTSNTILGSCSAYNFSNLSKTRIDFQNILPSVHSRYHSNGFYPFSIFSDGLLLYIFGVEIGSRTPKGHEIPTQDRVILPIIHIFFVKKIENERTYTLIGSVDFEIGHFHRILTAWYGASFGVSNKLQGVFKDLGKDLLVCFLQKGSWYTNGHYVAFVSPPWEYGNVVPASHSVEKNMRSFSGIFKLGTAELVDLKILEIPDSRPHFSEEAAPQQLLTQMKHAPPIMYNPSENKIWLYCIHKSTVFGFSSFEKPRIPAIFISWKKERKGRRRVVRVSGNSSRKSCAFEKGMEVFKEEKLKDSREDSFGELEVNQAAYEIVTVVGKMASLHYTDSFSFSEMDSQNNLKEDFIIEVGRETFTKLYRILFFAKDHLLQICSTEEIIGESELCRVFLSILFWCLYLLKINLERFTKMKISPIEIGISLKDLEKCGGEKCDDLLSEKEEEEIEKQNPMDGEDLIFSLRKMLVQIVDWERNELLQKVSTEIFEEEEEHPSKRKTLLQKISKEACSCLTIGFDLFYPTFFSQRNLLFELLNKNETSFLSATIKTLSHRKTISSLFSFPQLSQVRETPPTEMEIIKIFTSLLNNSRDSVRSSLATFGEGETGDFRSIALAKCQKIAQETPALRLLLAIQKDLIERTKSKIELEEETREFLSFESVLLLYSKVIFQHVGEQSLAYVHLMANQHSFHNKLNEAQELFLDLAVIASIVLSPLIHNLSIYSKKIQFLNNLLPSLLNLLKHTNSVCSSLERESQETDLSEEIDAFTFSWTPRSPLPFVTEGNGGISYSLPKTFKLRKPAPADESLLSRPRTRSASPNSADLPSSKQTNPSTPDLPPTPTTDFFSSTPLLSPRPPSCSPRKSSSAASYSLSLNPPPSTSLLRSSSPTKPKQFIQTKISPLTSALGSPTKSPIKTPITPRETLPPFRTPPLTPPFSPRKESPLREPADPTITPIAAPPAPSVGLENVDLFYSSEFSALASDVVKVGSQESFQLFLPREEVSNDLNVSKAIPMNQDGRMGEEKEVIHIPGALLMCLSFNVKCHLKPEVSLSIYQDPEHKILLKKIRKRWPRKSILFQGDTVYLSYSYSLDSLAGLPGSPREKNRFVAYDCLVTSFVPRTCINLQWFKSFLCSMTTLSASFSSSLIRGIPLTDVERDHKNFDDFRVISRGFGTFCFPDSEGGEREKEGGEGEEDSNSDSEITPTPIHRRFLQKTMRRARRPSSLHSAIGISLTKEEDEKEEEEEGDGEMVEGTKRKKLTSSDSKGSPKLIPFKKVSEGKEESKKEESRSRKRYKRFCVPLLGENSPSSSLIPFVIWLEKRFPLNMNALYSKYGVAPLVQRIRRCAIIASLHHSGLVSTALLFSRSCKKQSKSKSKSRSSLKDSLSIPQKKDGKELNPPPELLVIFQNATKICKILFQQLQDHLLGGRSESSDDVSGSVEESLSGRGLSSPSRGISSFSVFANEVMKKGMMLLNIQPILPHSKKRKTTEKFIEKVELISKEVVEFMTSDLTEQYIVEMVSRKRFRANTRLRGLLAMDFLITNLDDPFVTREALCLLSSSVRKYKQAISESWPYHYLDGLQGIEESLVSQISARYWSLMSKVSKFVANSSSDELCLMSLDSFALLFRPNDFKMLKKLNFFQSLSSISTMDCNEPQLSLKSGFLKKKLKRDSCNLLLLLGMQGVLASSDTGIFSTKQQQQRQRLESPLIPQSPLLLLKQRQQTSPQQLDSPLKTTQQPNLKPQYSPLKHPNEQPRQRKHSPLIQPDDEGGYDELKQAMLTFFINQLQSLSVTMRLSCEKLHSQETFLSKITLPCPFCGTEVRCANNREYLLLFTKIEKLQENFKESMNYVMHIFEIIEELTKSSEISKSFATQGFIQELFNSTLRSPESFRSIIFRLLRRLLPFVPPTLQISLNSTGVSSSVLEVLFSMVGGSLRQSFPHLLFGARQEAKRLSELNSNPFFIMREFTQSLPLSWEDIILGFRIGEDLLKPVRGSGLHHQLFRSTSGISLTHPFFPDKDFRGNLPRGWKPVDNTPHFRFKFSGNERREVTIIEKREELILPKRRKSIGEPEACVQTDLPMNKGDFFYFEVLIQKSKSHGMCIGFATKNWLKRGENKGENGSYNSRDNFQKKGEVGRLCFHDSGQIRHGKNPSQEYGPMFGEGDVIGCGWHKNGDVYFTKNGEFLGVAFRNMKNSDTEYLGFFGTEKGTISVIANFGQIPFRFHLAIYLRAQNEMEDHPHTTQSVSTRSFLRDATSLLRILLRDSTAWNSEILKLVTEQTKCFTQWVSSLKIEDLGALDGDQKSPSQSPPSPLTLPRSRKDSFPLPLSPRGRGSGIANYKEKERDKDKTVLGGKKDFIHRSDEEDAPAFHSSGTPSSSSRPPPRPSSSNFATSALYFDAHRSSSSCSLSGSAVPSVSFTPVMFSEFLCGIFIFLDSSGSSLCLNQRVERLEFDDHIFTDFQRKLGTVVSYSDDQSEVEVLWDNSPHPTKEKRKNLITVDEIPISTIVSLINDLIKKIHQGSINSFETIGDLPQLFIDSLFDCLKNIKSHSRHILTALSDISLDSRGSSSLLETSQLSFCYLILKIRGFLLNIVASHVPKNDFFSSLIQREMIETILASCLQPGSLKDQASTSDWKLFSQLVDDHLINLALNQKHSRIPTESSSESISSPCFSPTASPLNSPLTPLVDIGTLSLDESKFGDDDFILQRTPIPLSTELLSIDLVEIGKAVTVLSSPVKTNRTNWVSEMDFTIGRVGIVIAIDHKGSLVQVQFTDYDTFSSFPYETINRFISCEIHDKCYFLKGPCWWYSIDSLTHASTPMSYLPLVLKKNPSITMKDSLAFGIQVEKAQGQSTSREILKKLICLHPTKSLGRLVSRRRRFVRFLQTELSFLEKEEIESRRPSDTLYFSKLRKIFDEFVLPRDDLFDSEPRLSLSQMTKQVSTPKLNYVEHESSRPSLSPMTKQVSSLSMPKSVLKGKIKGEKDKDESKLIISSPEIYLNKDGGGNSNIISNSNTGTSGSGSGSEGKSGTMYMKGKVFKKWKKYWFVLRDRSLSYFKSRQTNYLFGVISIQNIGRCSHLSEDHHQVNKKDIQQKDRIFEITEDKSTIFFLTENRTTKTEWMKAIHKMMNARPSRHSMMGSPSIYPAERSVFEIIMDEVESHIKMLFQKKERSPIVVESGHNLAQSSARTLVHRPDAEAIIIDYDEHCETDPIKDSLSIYLSPSMEACRTSGKGLGVYEPVIIKSDHFLFEFQSSSRSTNRNWGYKLDVATVALRKSDEGPLASEPDFGFVYAIVSWLLEKGGNYAAQTFSSEIFGGLCETLRHFLPLTRKLKIISLLTKIVHCYNTSGRKNRCIDFSKLMFLKQEMFKVVKNEKATCAGDHTLYTQALVELIIQSELKSGLHGEDLLVTDDIRSLHKTNRKQFKEKIKHRTWYLGVFSLVKEMSSIRFSNRYQFSSEFLRQSCVHASRNLIVEQSPHPYPNGVRVTARVFIPCASHLIIDFDTRTNTEQNRDFLMFSRNTPGGDELGSFSGDFGGWRTRIEGDRFVWSFLSDAASTHKLWGFRFKVTPVIIEEVQEKKNKATQKKTSYVESIDHLWTEATDQEIVRFIDRNCVSSGPSYNLTFRSCDLSYFETSPILKDIPVTAIEARFDLMKYFNWQIEGLLPFINLRNSHQEWCISHLIGVFRALIFSDVKENIFSNSLLFHASALPFESEIELDRQDLDGSEKKKQRNELDPSSNVEDTEIENKCLFSQLWKETIEIPCHKLRHNDQPFSVKFKGEGATDAGGPYRECITQCFQESFSTMNLFVPCGNAVANVGLNEDLCVPNARYRSDNIRLSQYYFFGKLIGICLRTRNTVEIPLSSLFWKGLVGSEVDVDDLAAVELNLAKFLEEINSLDPKTSADDLFSLFALNFTVQTNAGETVELVAGGKDIEVDWKNKEEYAELTLNYRLKEFDSQIDSIKKGIASIIPVDIFTLFTWQQLEHRVCGIKTFDPARLKAQTVYVGYSASDPVIEMFWMVIQSFNPTQLVSFLRFVWGRSRLPADNYFPAPFRIQAFTKDGNPDTFLPESHTCFFSLSLPAYSSSTKMKEKLLYAISFCKTIDSDYLVQDDGNGSLQSLSSAGSTEEIWDDL